MKKLLILLCWLMMSQLTQAQVITGELSYPINDDIIRCPQFMIKLNLDLLGAPSNYSVEKITFDVGYSCQGSFENPGRACATDGSLPFVMYAQGTRYPDMSWAIGDTVERTYLEARQKWWTFPNVVVDQPYQKLTNVTFLVGRGPAISYRAKFNVMQLYFKFLKATLRNGDWITINFTNVHVYQPGQTNFTKLPDFPVRFRIEDLTGVEEELVIENEELPPKVYDTYGRLVQSSLDKSQLPNGVYYLVSGRKTRPLMVVR